MKIGLMGLEFESANRGCEALVYSFLSIIERNFNNGCIVFNFSGTSLGKVTDAFPRFQFRNINPKIKDFKFTYIKALSQCDYIFDATMGDSFSDIYSKEYYKHLSKHKKLAEFFCKRYILLPQTYGPFESKDSLKIARDVLNKAYKIYCRDEMSQKLLKNTFQINDSILVSDMAFVLPYDKNMYSFSSCKKKIGINVSGLLFKGGFHTENQFGLTLNYPELIDRLINDLSKKFEIHLIPHVIDLKEDAYDDDYKTCDMLHQKYSNTIMAPVFDTPIQAKSYISNMDIFIGSRMHSTIASFSSGVVTIPISYSRKFEGLFGSLDYPFVVNAREETTESAYQLVMKYIYEVDILKKTQVESLKLINEKNEEFKKSILKLIEGDK